MERLAATIAAAAIQALILAVLLSGPGFRTADRADQALKLVDLAPEEPPPPETRPAPPGSTASFAERAAPASPVVAPPPAVPLPSPNVTAPAAGEGEAAAAGGGAGGTGAGTGRGSGDGGRGAHAERVQGALLDSDYPRAARRAGAEGVVFVRFIVQPNGRVGDCAVTRSSGHPALDATTCRLIEKRFRYRPARDAEGRAVPEAVQLSFEWGLRR